MNVFKLVYYYGLEVKGELSEDETTLIIRQPVNVETFPNWEPLRVRLEQLREGSSGMFSWQVITAPV